MSTSAIYFSLSFSFHYNQSYNLIKTDTIVFYPFYFLSVKSLRVLLLSFCLIFCQFQQGVPYKKACTFMNRIKKFELNESIEFARYFLRNFYRQEKLWNHLCYSMLRKARQKPYHHIIFIPSRLKKSRFFIWSRLSYKQLLSKCCQQKIRLLVTSDFIWHIS